MHLAIWWIQILLNCSNIMFLRFSVFPSRIISSLLALTAFLPIPITSSIPLYYGLYTGVYVYIKPSSSILLLVSLALCSDKLSIINNISSKGYFSRSSSRKVKNFLLLIDLSWTCISSMPASLEIPNNMACTFILTSEESSVIFVFGRVQACVVMVFFVIKHSSSWIILNFLSIPLYMSYRKSETWMVMSYRDGTFGILPILMHFLRILYLA